MGLFDSVRTAVTARQAAERYGLQFDRSGRRARCIWHSPDRHARSLPLPPVISAARFAGVCRRIAAVCPSLSRRRFGYNQAIKAKEADFP